MVKDWFFIENISQFDSPLLVVYADRIRQNIQMAIDMIGGDTNRLRPHVKTNKMSEVCTMMMQAGITRFKCATIAEAEMLAMTGAPDILMAYQPVGPKTQRFITLIKTYPATRFSCLVDNKNIAVELNNAARLNDVRLSVFIDINTGMNRTGIAPGEAFELAKYIHQLASLSIAGLHAYDGHIHDSDIAARKEKTDSAFEAVTTLQSQLSSFIHYPLIIVAGGTPTFPVHSQRSHIECSPGTFVFSDWGYKHSLPDEPFVYAALVITRVICVIDEQTICMDLGHKSVAAENPLPRVHFLNAPDAIPVSQSEEHLVLKIPPGSNYKIGDVFYGVPVHICPTVALYDKAHVVQDGIITTSWRVIARDRSITI